MALVAAMVFINARLVHNLTKQQKEFYAEKESLIWQLERKDEMLKKEYDVYEEQKNKKATEHGFELLGELYEFLKKSKESNE